MSEIINFEPFGVCCDKIIVEIENDIIKNVDFIGGCQGNLRGIRSLVIGENIDKISKKLRGIPCGQKSTSCPDQFAQCLEQYINEKSKTAIS